MRKLNEYAHAECIHKLSEESKRSKAYEVSFEISSDLDENFLRLTIIDVNRVSSRCVYLIR